MPSRKKATDCLHWMGASKDPVDITLANSLLQGAMKMQEDEKAK